MPPIGGPRRQSFLTEEEKKNRPKVTKEMLKRIFSYLKPYRKPGNISVQRNNPSESALRKAGCYRRRTD